MASTIDSDAQDFTDTAIAGAERVSHILKLLSQEKQQQEQVHLNDLAHEAISIFKKFVSLLGQTDHGRIRRGPKLPIPAEDVNMFMGCTCLAEVSSSEAPSSDHGFLELSLSQQTPRGEGSTTTSSTITGSASTNVDSSQHNGQQAFHFAMVPQVYFGGQAKLGFLNSDLSLENSVSYSSNLSKSLLSTIEDSGHNSQQFLSSMKHNGKSEDTRAMRGHNGRTCPRKRKSRIRRVIKVPAISSKNADIPPDGFSWRKYGQKIIKGLSHPRGYYKCSVTKSCPAKKHVDRCLDDPSMLIVTYEGEHVHSVAHSETMQI